MIRTIFIVAATLLIFGCGGSTREKEGAVVAGIAGALTAVQIVRAKSLQVQPTQETCTYFCTFCTFPCGDDCLPYGSMCTLPPGKACWANDMGACPDVNHGIIGVIAPLIVTSQ